MKNRNEVFFISGSRSIKTLSQEVKNTIERAIDAQSWIIIGDCYGVDSSVQSFLKDKGYDRVFVFHIGEEPRYNLGSFRTVRISGNRYSDKDIAMCNKCTCAMAIRDGVSKGTQSNIARITAQGKPCKVVLS